MTKPEDTFIGIEAMVIHDAKGAVIVAVEPSRRRRGVLFWLRIGWTLVREVARQRRYQEAQAAERLARLRNPEQFRLK